MGMPVNQFIDAAYKGLADGGDQIVIGDVAGSERLTRIIDERRAAFKDLAKMMQSR